MILAIIAEVQDEVERAVRKFPPFHSAHEGYAVLLEEVEELKAEIFHGDSREAMREEAVQVAAMAIRLIMDVCETDAHWAQHKED